MGRTRTLAFASTMAALALVVSAASAQAQPGSLTITMFATVPLPANHGKAAKGVPGTGTFTIKDASGTQIDSGGLSLFANFDAVPAPQTGVLTSKRTLTAADGTISLSCTQRVTPPLFGESPPGELLETGTCTVTRGSGAYAGLHGSGSLTGVAIIGSTEGSVTDTLDLRTA